MIAAEVVNIPLRHKLLLRELVKIKQRYFDKTKINLLDIGGSNGAFLELVKTQCSDFEEAGLVEIDDHFKERILNFGKFYYQDLQMGTGDIPSGKYQVITMWELVEHIENNYGLFRNIYKLLPPNGLIAISTPNVCSLSRLIKGEKWIGVRDKSHKVLMSHVSLKMILENCGFEVILSRNYFFPNRLPPALDWFNNLISAFPGGGMLFMAAVKRSS